jgi:5-methylcytosine-specific restriction endonuclease McrA
MTPAANVFKMSEGYISGTIRYEVLKSANFRCELCGVSADIKVLEVDHLVPTNNGRSNDPSNFRALPTRATRDETRLRRHGFLQSGRGVSAPTNDLRIL